MVITINGETKPLENKYLSDALVAWGYSMNLPMAIAVNYAVVPHSAYATWELKPNDIIEILMPMQGG
ncbi:sulfur carrier protein ThiS [Legionella sp. km772]|uniref:sulfur carrier protein ThiS n=1 Tax=Legionella sp. km772 TaxID=2498111 RepID=UPI001315A63C|nr:sulfur carrier protein ThiS [Legionella sp. km772]